MELLNFDDTGYGDELLAGVFITIRLALLSFSLALILGVVLGFVALAKNRLLQAFWRTYASVFMGVPSILIVFFLYFNAPGLLKSAFNLRVDVTPFVAGVSALAIVYAAYVGEAVRGAVLNIPRGQWDAAHALGLRNLSMWWLVILPQIWRIALPGVTNVWMTTLKDTALVSLVGLTDLVRMADIAAAATQEPFLFYVVAGLVFVVFSGLTMAGSVRLERWAFRGQQKTKG
ncbi:MAG: ABC transporter permease subunit [Arenicellales bacterium]|jgi:polar amino acid transport system permease protein|nr:ABC transporter permease subunit [Arenicellales bacterium]MDP7617728.1 ABC transporter permease subunit [Arenicellales bacterium]|tara:strand:- start:1878 stop:2570 length:693 start_codon:yes stop_codon:yes gene_type:complete